MGDAGLWGLGSQCFPEAPGIYLAHHKCVLGELTDKQEIKYKGSIMKEYTVPQ